MRLHSAALPRAPPPRMPAPGGRCRGCLHTGDRCRTGRRHCSERRRDPECQPDGVHASHGRNLVHTLTPVSPLPIDTIGAFYPVRVGRVRLTASPNSHILAQMNVRRAAAKPTPAVALFDLDGTLTWRDTLLPFLAGYACRHPTRLLRLWPLSLPSSAMRRATAIGAG